MKCPACSNDLSRKEAGGVKVDICEGGCGGIWFDNHELKKFDEPHESAGESLLDVEKSGNLKVDMNAKRKCPKCDNITMMQHFFSVKREVMIDECPNCAGVWLDVGELRQIRKQFDSEEERKKAASDYFGDVIDAGMTQVGGDTRARTEKRKKFANIFKYICPTQYIPGDQDWGAF